MFRLMKKVLLRSHETKTRGSVIVHQGKRLRPKLASWKKYSEAKPISKLGMSIIMKNIMNSCGVFSCTTCLRIIQAWRHYSCCHVTWLRYDSDSWQPFTTWHLHIMYSYITSCSYVLLCRQLGHMTPKYSILLPTE